MQTLSIRTWAAAASVLFASLAAHAWNPVANPDNYTTERNITLSVSAPGVLANDTDADGDALTAVRVTNPSHGTLTLNANGSFTYRPATNYTGSDSFTYKANDGRRNSSTVTVNITVTPPTVTIVTPPTNQTVCPGDTATFSVVASGSGLRYQWRFGSTSLANQTNSTLVISNAQSGNAGTYSVAVTSSSGGSKTNSATLTVRTTVNATALTSLTRFVGSIAIFSVTPSGTGPFSYVWRRDNTVLPGQTSSSLVLSNVQASHSGTYSVTVNGPCGSVTRSASLMVDTCFPALDVMIVLDRSGSMQGKPYNDARLAATNLVRNLHLGGTNLDQAALVSYNSSATLDRMLTNNGASVEQAIGNMPGAGGLTCISCALQTGQAELQTTRHKTNALPVIVLLSDGMPTGSDTTSNSLFAAQQAKNSGTRIFTVGLGDVDHDLMRGIASSPGDYYYTTNSSQLTALFDTISTVICRPPTNIFGPSNTIVCAGANVTLRVDASGCESFTYQWRRDGVALAGKTNNTLVLNNVQPTNAGVYSVAVNSPCRNQTNTATLTVNAPATIVTPPANQVGFVGSNVTFNVSATGTALTYAWRRSGSSAVLGTNNSLTLNNLTTNLAGGYCVTVTGGACGGPVTNCATLTFQNRAPIAANDDSYTTPEDTTLNVPAPGILANDSDPDGDTLRTVLVSNPSNGALTLNADGSFTYIPNLNFNGIDTFTYRASDGSLVSEIARVTITVTPRNDPPVANNDAYTMTAGTTLDISAPGVLVNDTDVENNPLTAVSPSAPAHGVVTLNANGSFTYRPATNYSGTDSFTYRASDGSATSGVATVTITINPVPVIIVEPPINRTNCPGDSAIFTVAATGTALTYQWLFGSTVLIGQTNATLILNNVQPTNAGNYCVLVNGAQGGPITNCAVLVVNQNVVVTVPPTNAIVCQNSTAQFTVGATGTALMYQWFFGFTTLTNQTNSTLTLLNVGLSAAGTYTVVVSGACAPPVTNSAALTVNQNLVLQTPPTPQRSLVGSNATFIVGATGTGLTYQWFFNGSIVGTNNVLNLNNLATNQAGTYCVVVSGACGAPVTNCTILTIENRPPVANNDSYTVAEDNVLLIERPGVLGNDSDPDGDALTAILVSGPTHGTLILSNNGAFRYTPNTNFTGVDTFTYRANDTKTSSVPAIVTITVTPRNDPPVAANDAYTIIEDTTLPVSAPGVLANDSDVDGDTLAAVLVSNPAHGSLTLQPNGAFTYVPNLDYNGTDSFSYRANDGALTSSVAIVTITIVPTNDAPLAVNDDRYTTPEDTLLTIEPRGILTNDIDVDGDLLTALLVSTTTNGTLVLSTNGGFIYLPNTNFNGVDYFTYQATDGALTSGVAVVTITVTPVNDAPIAVNDDAYTTPEDTTLNISAPGILANDIDVDGDALQSSLVQSVSHGTLLLNSDGSFTYTPSLNYTGVDTFTYRATDSMATSGVATVTITVTPVNDPPVTGVLGDHYTVLEDHTLAVVPPGVLANDSDVDGDALISILVSGPSHGAVTLNANGSFMYRPATNYFGPDSFVYVANDGMTNSLPATVNIAVLPVNDAPTFVAGPNQKININAGMQIVTNWATGISPGPENESNQTAVFIVSTDNKPLFSWQPAITPSGTLKYTPAPGATGTANVRVVLWDNGGTANGGVDMSREVVFRITINAPPTVEIVSPEDGSGLIYPASFSVIASASDPDGTVTNVQFLVNGAFHTNIATAPFYFIMSNPPPGNYQFIAIATDDCGLTATSAPVSIEVITNAVVATGPLILNRQTGLFDQFVTISNRTSESWANGVRLSVYNVHAPNRVWNASGTNAGVPYLQNPTPVPAGGSIQFVVQYYVPDVRVVPSPTLIATPLPFDRVLQLPKITNIDCPDKSTVNVHFTTQPQRFYFIQSSEDFVHWTTAPEAMLGTGGICVKPENNSGAKRFYRLIMVP